ncbi:uncharacterized protein LOC6561069 [Drosophila grimshawi]|uniref:GH21057 n=1 Tax=Drosophila grimshawi TaxID=7222 RepID=B4J5I8_DROGR|nr:uncharacterized protein LOC6561069 [Drosophila grimshawi]EDW00751.1 GH21057 [Drosophila grimshawi]
MEDLTEILTLFGRNVNKLRINLSAYEVDVNNRLQTLAENWSHVARGEWRLSSAYDALISSVSQVNEYVIKLNLHINLNLAVGILNVDRDSVEHNKNKINHTNRHGIEVGEVDAILKRQQSSSNNELQIVKSPEDNSSAIQVCKTENNPNPVLSIKTEPPPILPRLNVKLESSLLAAPLTLPKLPIPPRKTKLLQPKGGQQMSGDAAYDMLPKNISSFVKDSDVLVAMMHLNVSENCIFVSKWGPESTPLKKLLACQMSIQQLDQLPDFGEIFAVYDAQEQIIPRVLINAQTEGGGYEAYLLDYGEHIHLDDKEVIFALPNEIKALPAEAIRCYVRNCEVTRIREFTFKSVRLRVLANNGNDLEVELLGPAEAESAMLSSVQLDLDAANNRAEMQSDQADQKLSPAALEMLEEVEQGTSNALKAVLGYKPTDDQRICRHYDPKLNGCFKGSNCRLLHQAFAPHGATKDKELVEALPECTYVSTAPMKIGSVVRVRVTFIKSSTQVYVQFQDELPLLVWNEKEVHESQRRFQRTPRVLDMVLALYNDDCFYRAQIIEEIDGIFKIFYVDYGNTEFVTIKSLAQCHNAASLKPHRAINCFIADVKCSSSGSQEKNAECVEFLKSKILNEKVDVKLIGHLPDGPMIKFLDSYASVTMQMIQRGYVESSQSVELS